MAKYTEENEQLGNDVDGKLKYIYELEAKIERLNIELEAMRGAANSYKMHNEELETENRILSQKRMNIFETCEAFERGRVKGIKEFAERVDKILCLQIGPSKRLFWKIKEDIDNLVKEMVGEGE